MLACAMVLQVSGMTHIFQYGHKIFLDSNPDHISCIVNDPLGKVWPILFHAHGFQALSSDTYSKFAGEEGKIPEQFKAVLPPGKTVQISPFERM